ncbi:hypothetical protein ACOMHN_004425 [Nucella lapillus]
MEVNPGPQLYSQDSLAAEMLNKLQSGSASGFTTVAVPEGITLQAPHPGSSLMSASSSILNPSLLSQTMGPTPGSAEGIILNPAGALDPALTQLLVAAQNASSLSGGGVSTALVPNVAVSCPPTSIPGLQPVLSSTLPAPPTPISSLEMALPAEPPPTIPTSAASQEAMTITVHCTMSDTVIVVGQQNWQCCMCREICGLDTSIDQHLSLKHNLCLKPVEEVRGVAKGLVPGGAANSDDKACAESKVKASAHQAFPTLPDSALASGQSNDSSNSRSGLEREVALLMAQTFTHSGGVTAAEEAKHQDSSFLSLVSSENQSDSLPFTGIASSENASKGLSSPAVEKTAGVFNAYEYMIDKVERAILSTVDTGAKNDLLLVATELARMQKDLTSKRRQMKKTHRYIPCPECGKEVRNRKDLIKQHNRCHEKTKKYRCLVCNRMFKYMHTLRRHIVQQNHQGGLPENLNMAPSPDQDPNDLSTAEDAGFEGLKMEVDECEEESEMIINVDFGALSSDVPAMTSQSKENKPQEVGEPAYEKILAALLSKGEQNRTPTGRKQSLLQCFVCDREIRNRNYYITRHARCHMEDLCYACSVCGIEFYRSDYYREHMSLHGNVPSPKDDDKKTSTQENKTKPCEPNQKQPNNKAKTRWAPKPATVMCRICDKEIFNRTYNIKRHARQHSIVEWESILTSPQHPSSGASENRSSGSGQQFVNCGLCGLRFHSYARKRLHMLTHRTTFQCRVCDSKFDSGAELLTHGQTCKKTSGEGSGSGAIEGSELPKENSTQDRNASVAATNQSSRGPTWKKQVSGQAPSPRKWTCPICQASIIHTLASISRHMRELHSEGQPHNCPQCHRTYTSYHKMQRHLKSHGDLGGICDVCGKTFQSKASLRNHTKLHASPEGMFQCPQCPTSFRFQSRLDRHMRKHQDRTDVCPHCGKVYISKVHLQRHISVDHLGIKDYRYKCGQCGAQFFENIQLRDHMAYRHQGVQIYSCKYCHKGFNCRPTMVRHERKEHTNYLPYKCKHCSQGFPEKSKLVAHEMTHTGMSPHKCVACGKYFTTGGALRAHRNLHMGIKPFECSTCGKTYLKNWHLQQHIRKAHQAYEVMVYNLPPPQGPTPGPGPTPQGQGQGQDLALPPVSQHSILPVLDQSCLQSAEPKFLRAAMQGDYVPVPLAKGSNPLQQQQQQLPGPGEGVQMMAQPTLVQPQ